MSRIGYVLKVYPRFSETFIVTEILAREELGDDLIIYALCPTTDSRFYPEIARVRAGVSWVPRPFKACELWSLLADLLPDVGQRSRLAGISAVVAGQGIRQCPRNSAHNSKYFNLMPMCSAKGRWLWDFV